MRNNTEIGSSPGACLSARLGACLGARKGPRHVRSRPAVTVLALFATVAVATSGCSSGTDAAVAPSRSPATTSQTPTVSTPSQTPTVSTPSQTPTVSTPSRVAPSPKPWPAPKRVTPAPAPRYVAGTPLERSVPVRLQIAAIGVSSSLMDLGLKSDGTMQTPPNAFPAGTPVGRPPVSLARQSSWAIST